MLQLIVEGILDLVKYCASGPGLEPFYTHITKELPVSDAWEDNGQSIYVNTTLLLSSHFLWCPIYNWLYIMYRLVI